MKKQKQSILHQSCRDAIYRVSTGFFGFTLIELLISISIIAIIGTIGLGTMQNFFIKQNNIRTADRIANNIDYLDKTIKMSLASDYEVTFVSGSYLYLTNINSFKKDHKIILDDFDFKTFSGMIEGTGTTSAGPWLVKFFRDSDLSSFNTNSGTINPVSFSLSGGLTPNSYKISSTLDGEDSNTYELISFTSNLITEDNESKIKLSSISGSSLFDKLIIKNTLGKKEKTGFYGGTGIVETGSIFLNFELGSQEFALEIK